LSFAKQIDERKPVMPRPSTKLEVQERLLAYLAIAEKHSPDEYPLDILSVAKAIGVSRGTLRNHGLIEVIKVAQNRQQHGDRTTGGRSGKQMFTETIELLRSEMAKLQAQYDNLQAERCIIEANAARLGVDSRELLRTLSKPDRRAPRTSQRSRLRRGR
jgi:hypothetical protein